MTEFTRALAFGAIAWCVLVLPWVLRTYFRRRKLTQRVDALRERGNRYPYLTIFMQDRGATTMHSQSAGASMKTYLALAACGVVSSALGIVAALGGYSSRIPEAIAVAFAANAVTFVVMAADLYLTKTTRR